ncbi:Uncharacterised protein [Streptococcus australis]|uniref:Uncharacterized protein n=1 Tax=Streptococcus viridans TaxID=78535 RepID=A0A3S4LBH4_9STRE|nr:Uncharacterised protein [Streptococcus viridans]VEE18990.1 Uncharacterised protein [Streptococcus australis]
MKSDHLKESKNIEDRRGQSGGSYSSGRSGGNLGGGFYKSSSHLEASRVN